LNSFDSFLHSQKLAQGIRFIMQVAVIDDGIYYLHPALGGCFGPGCKVAFGYGKKLKDIFSRKQIKNTFVRLGGR